MEKCGISYPSTILWKEWEPGKEYHKRITLKNITRAVLMVDFYLEDYSAFDTKFPGPIRMNAGVSADIDVVFKPAQSVDHLVKLRLNSSKGPFCIILNAIASKISIECPKGLDFGGCAVKATTESPFQFSNTGDKPTPYEWIVEPPFSISPRSGLILPSETVLGTCYFKPEKACAYTAQALCLSNGKQITSMDLKGIGKYTFLHMSPSVLEFGDVVMGSSKEMVFKMVNTSEALAKIHLEVIEDYVHPLSTVFTLNNYEFSIQPRKEVEVKVLYTPVSVGKSSMAQIKVTSSLQCASSIICLGSAIQPSITISKRALDFGSLSLGNTSSRNVSICNASPVHVSFQFMIPLSGTFHFRPPKGVIMPGSSVCVNIDFKPGEVANYYKRIICIIQDHAPLYCDLVGCCFQDTVNFSTVKVDHVKSFREGKNDNVEHQLGYPNESITKDIGPEILNTLDPSSILFQKIQPVCRVDEVWEEYFLGKTLQCDFIEITQTSFEFGMIPYLSHSAEKIFTIKNTSKYPVSCLWHTPEIQNGDTSKLPILLSKGPWLTKKKENVFQITPLKATLNEECTMTFRVRFAPDKENQHYSDTLDVSIVQHHPENHAIPPCSASIYVSGNSFGSHKQEFLSQAYFFPPNVLFPPILQGFRAYHTIALRNRACTPLRFSFETRLLGKDFTVKPAQGVIEEDSFQLISFKFIAHNPSMHVVKLPCILNGDRQQELELILVGQSEFPEVQIEESGIVHFKPTNIGLHAKRVLTMQNHSCVPAFFKWDVPVDFKKVFTINPLHGVIKGRQRLQLHCNFYPSSTSDYRVQIPCTINSVIDMATYNGQVGITLNMIPGTESMNIYSTFQGQGIEGSMRVDPRTMDLGTIIVGFCQQRKLTIHNSTKGTLNYIIDFKSLDDTNIEDYDLKLDCSQGTIVASSTKDVIISFKPKTASEFRISIFCSLFYSNAPPETYNEMLPQCILCAKAMFPSLSIMRVRGGHFTQTKAWRRLCLDDLQCILAEAEFNQPAGFHGSYDMFGLGGHIEKLLVSPFKFYVGRSHLGSKPTIFELVLKTRNDLPVSWRIRLWNDKESDMENWVDEPEPSNEMENLYMTILEHRLIKVWPHHGHLKPHEEQHIKITYKHVLEGFHEIPAILHIENGHSVPLLLCGETIPCEENILTIEDNIFMLKPIAIENTNPHLQTFELQNDGDSTFTYNVNLEPLRHLRAENYGFEVLRCLNPRGTIPPKESILLNWLFQPIEPKRYITEVLISIDHGKGVTLAIEGYGFKEETRKQENDSKEDDLHLDIPFDTNPFKSLGWLDLPGILSLEHLSFGEVNVVSSIERLVAIKNTSKASRVSFRWDSSYCAESCVHGKFNITPSEGVIECGESCVCQVTFTARLEPQAFETTLHCHVMEMPLVAIQAPQKEEPYEEVFAEHWDIQHKVGTYDKIGAQKALERKKIAEKTQGEQRESALEKLTISVREKLPRLTAKGPLKFPSLSDKMPEEEVEEKPYREGTLFLNVTARIVNNEKRPQLLSQLKCQQNCQGDDCISELSHASSLLMDILYDSAQEILGAQSLESHLLKATMPFFEQCIGLSSNNQALINQNIDVCQDEKNSHIQNTNNECYTHSGSIEKKPTYSIFNPMPKEVERIMLHVNVFDISKIVLEQMMFEVIKDLHDCKINFPPTSKGMKPSL